MFELNINWIDYTPIDGQEQYTFTSRRNRMVNDWWKKKQSSASRSAIINFKQKFKFELREDYDSFLELLASLQT